MVRGFRSCNALFGSLRTPTGIYRGSGSLTLPLTPLKPDFCSDRPPLSYYHRALRTPNSVSGCWSPKKSARSRAFWWDFQKVGSSPPKSEHEMTVFFLAKKLDVTYPGTLGMKYSGVSPLEKLVQWVRSTVGVGPGYFGACGPGYSDFELPGSWESNTAV